MKVEVATNLGCVAAAPQNPSPLSASHLVGGDEAAVVRYVLGEGHPPVDGAADEDLLRVLPHEALCPLPELVRRLRRPPDLLLAGRTVEAASVVEAVE